MGNDAPWTIDRISTVCWGDVSLGRINGALLGTASGFKSLGSSRPYCMAKGPMECRASLQNVSASGLLR